MVADAAQDGKTEAQRVVLFKALKRNVQFSGLEDAELQNIVGEFLPVDVLPGQLLIQQGAANEYFFVVERGELGCWGYSPAARISTVGAGNTIGEGAITGQPAMATVRAVASSKGPLRLWRINSAALRAHGVPRPRMVVGDQRLKFVADLLRAQPLFDLVDDTYLEQLTRSFFELRFAPGEVVLAQGERPDNFYIVRSGSCALSVQSSAAHRTGCGDDGAGSFVGIMRPGDTFGEIGLLLDAPRAATVVAGTSGASLFAVGRPVFQRLVQGVGCSRLHAVFDLHASVEWNGERWMTLGDFMRSLRPAGAVESELSRATTAPDPLALLFRAADHDGTQQISFPDFVALNYLLKQEGSELAVAFRLADTDKDGRLDASELDALLRGLGRSTLSQEERDSMHGLSTAGYISVEEFQALARPGGLLHARLKDTLEGIAEERRLFLRSVGQWSCLGIDIGDTSFTVSKAGGEQVAGRAATGLSLGTQALHALVAGGIAGAVSRTATAPLDRLKVLLQVQAVMPATTGGRQVVGVRQGLQCIYAEGGFRAYFRGNGANVVKIAPESACKFMLYETLKLQLFGRTGGLNISQQFVAGALAGSVSQFAIYPLEVVKTRLAASPAGTYDGILDVLRSVHAKNGVRGLYRGVMPALLGIVPYAGVDLAIYDSLKQKVARHNLEAAAPLAPLFCGTISSTVGQTVAYPLALLRTQMQMQEGATDGGLALRQLAENIYSRDGIRGFYRGIGPNLLKVIPAVSTSYTVYEFVKTRLKGPA